MNEIVYFWNNNYNNFDYSGMYILKCSCNKFYIDKTNKTFKTDIKNTFPKYNWKN